MSSIGDHGDDLLSEHVERIAGIPRRLDASLVHQLRDGCARQQVAAELRDDHAFADRVDAMPGAADALQAARHRRRGLDLHDEVDRAHVDAEFERRGGDERGQRAGLQPVFDLDALFARERAVMRARQRLRRRVR